MPQQLIPHNGDYLLPLDQSILDRLRIAADTRFEVLTDGDRLVLIPIRGAKSDAEFQKALADAREQFGEVLRLVPGD